MSFFDDLQNATAESRQYLLDAPIIQDVLQKQFSLETYVCFLNQAFHHVKHTIPLLMAAGSRLSAQQLFLQRPLASYIEEEIGHEQWILNDIEACGFDRNEYEHAGAPYSSELLVAFLYDYVQRKNPVGIFGMVQVLEGTSASLAPQVAAIVQDELGLQKSAMTYLTTHGELDQVHMQHFERVMNQIESAADQQAVLHVAQTVYRLYGDVYRSIPGAALEMQYKRLAA